MVESRRVGEGAGVRNLYVKNEGQNPTGSFKDRGMTVAITRARQLGAKVLVCASTGNTSASLAAYAAKSGMKAAVVVPSGKVAAGKLVQAVAYGVKIVRVEGGFDRALALTREAVATDHSFYLMNSVNPFRLEGQKTVAYEVFEQLGRVPDVVVMPVGNAGNISAAWKGFRELKDWGVSEGLPRMVGVQAAGAAPIAAAVENGANEVKPWKEPETVASAIRIGQPVSWRKALNAIRQSGGMAFAVSDSEIVGARTLLATRGGIFVEAASAVPVAALGRVRELYGEDATVVCVATGNGLKDQESISVRLPESAVSDVSSLVREVAG